MELQGNSRNHVDGCKGTEAPAENHSPEEREKEFAYSNQPMRGIPGKVPRSQNLFVQVERERGGEIEGQRHAKNTHDES
jgi:hypothetical protein